MPKHSNVTLVTGATGILGRVIVLELLKRGKVVRATKRIASDLDEVRKSFRFYTNSPDEFFQKIEWVNVDFDDSGSLKSALNGVEEVYHCAAKVSFHPAKRKEIFHTNIEGTRNLLYACEGSSVKKFLFVSSIAVLDGLNEKGMADEDSDFNPKLEHSDYAASKHFSEMEVWRAAAEGLDVAIINPGMIIGSGNWNQSSGEIFGTAEKNNYTFSGATSYVDVRDVAKIAVELMEKNIFNERFILVSEDVKYFDFTKNLREKMGLSVPKVLPGSILNVGRFFNFLFGWAFPKLRMVNNVNVDSVCSLKPISNKKIKEKLNYEFIPVEESIDFHIKNYIKDTRSKAKRQKDNPRLLNFRKII